MINIFKFGGASVKDAQGVENLSQIVKGNKGSLVVVVSAMGKTTNALENLLIDYLNGGKELRNSFKRIKDQHIGIAQQLFGSKASQSLTVVENILKEIEEKIKVQPTRDYNYYYDQIVSYGEILSTTLVSLYLNAIGIENTWVDIRKVIRTDWNYREGNVDYITSQLLASKEFRDSENSKIFVTQGFIGGTEDGQTTTLGREGSDYTAALLGHFLNAKNITIWKDVDGVLNADPRIFKNTVKLDKVSFKEAIELAYCGAQIIHPKTIKPLQNKNIELFVKSFANPESSGTLVLQTDQHIPYPPILILKPKQVLISLAPRDFSFVIEDCLSKIFATLYKHRVKANLVQSSAISFSICVDDEEHFLPGAIEELSEGFQVKYNKGLQLLTIRHYSDQIVDEMQKGKSVFLQQKTRSTIRIVFN
jgi:aspartate kinase